MFKVLGWGGGCGGCHMKFSDNPESKLAFPNWGSIRWGWDLDFRLGLRLVQFNFDILLNSDK